MNKNNSNKRNQSNNTTNKEIKSITNITPYHYLQPYQKTIPIKKDFTKIDKNSDIYLITFNEANQNYNNHDLEDIISEITELNPLLIIVSTQESNLRSKNNFQFIIEKKLEMIDFEVYAQKKVLTKLGILTGPINKNIMTTVFINNKVRNKILVEDDLKYFIINNYISKNKSSEGILLNNNYINFFKNNNEKNLSENQKKIINNNFDKMINHLTAKKQFERDFHREKIYINDKLINKSLKEFEKELDHYKIEESLKNIIFLICNQTTFIYVTESCMAYARKKYKNLNGRIVVGGDENGVTFKIIIDKNKLLIDCEITFKISNVINNAEILEKKQYNTVFNLYNKKVKIITKDELEIIDHYFKESNKCGLGKVLEKTYFKGSIYLETNLKINEKNLKLILVNSHLFYEKGKDTGLAKRKKQFFCLIEEFELIKKWNDGFYIFFVGDLNFRLLSFNENINDNYNKKSKNIIDDYVRNTSEYKEKFTKKYDKNDELCKIIKEKIIFSKEKTNDFSNDETNTENNSNSKIIKEKINVISNYKTNAENNSNSKIIKLFLTINFYEKMYNNIKKLGLHLTSKYYESEVNRNKFYSAYYNIFNNNKYFINPNKFLPIKLLNKKDSKIKMENKKDSEIENKKVLKTRFKNNSNDLKNKMKEFLKKYKSLKNNLTNEDERIYEIIKKYYVTYNNINKEKEEYVEKKKTIKVIPENIDIFEINPKKDKFPRIPSMTDRILFVEPKKSEIKLKIEPYNFNIFFNPNKSDHLMLGLNLVIQ